MRYDGKTFETFTTMDGLTDNTVFRIVEDYQGRIWFMTYNKVLCYYDDGSFYPFVFNDSLHKYSLEKSATSFITHFEIDEQDNIIIVLATYTVIEIDNCGEVVEHPYPGREELDSLISWTDKEKDNIKKLVQTSHVRSQDFSGKKSLLKKARGAERIFYYKDQQVICTWKGAFMGKSGEPVKRIFPNDFITGFCKDFEGGLWFTSTNSGVYYIPDYTMHIFQFPNKAGLFFPTIIEQKEELIFRINDDVIYKFNSGSIVPAKKKLKYGLIPKDKRKEGVSFPTPIQLYVSYSDLRLSTLRHKFIETLSFFEIEDTILFDFTSARLGIVRKIVY